MTIRQRHMKLGTIMYGVGATPEGWRDPDVRGDESIDIQWYIKIAQAAEAAGYDLALVTDSPYVEAGSLPHLLNRLEPVTVLSALAVSTKRIGLVATLTTSFWEPFNAARLLQSLDLISDGRAGWNVVTTGLDGVARNFGQDSNFAHSERYERAREFLEVARGLWDSFEDDAFPRDKETGVFLDPSKMHSLNHKGRFFSVAGPMPLSRSRQGHPVIFQAGDSVAGRDFAAETAEGIFTLPENFTIAQSFYAEMKERMASKGRNPEHLNIFPGLNIQLADTDEEAFAIEEARHAKVGIDRLLKQFSRMFGYLDFSKYPLDEPFPDITALVINGFQGHVEHVTRTARDEGLTLRDVAKRFGSIRSNFMGSPSTVADQMQHWFEQGAADGFLVHVANPREFERFNQTVIPILQERGLFKTDYVGVTLRDHLGLTKPLNSYSQRAELAVGDTLGSGLID